MLPSRAASARRGRGSALSTDDDRCHPLAQQGSLDCPRATAETRSNRRLGLRSVGAAPFGAALSGTQAATAMKRDAYPPTHLPWPVHSAARRVTREGRLGISRCASQFGCRLTLGDSASAPGWGVCALLRIRTHTHTHCAQLQDRRIDSRRRRRGWRRCAGGHRCRCAGGHRQGRRGPHRAPPGAARLYCAEYDIICFVCRIASAVHRVPVRFIIIAVMMINCIAMYHFVFSGHHTI